MNYTGSDSFPPGSKLSDREYQLGISDLLCSLICYIPVTRHRAAASVQHPSKGEVFQPPQGKADARAFAEGVLHLLDNFQDDLMLLLLAGVQKRRILPLCLE